ncbi:hypothetical protein JYU34_003514 [Plutella xylostella]|uniref:leucine--tRNA ligase n=1 Tax=Plutella xylostella TaxID=51655 RepID=A0ABQ7R0C3_PLUXY|nr:hypothetical protein JYU34_003514 [Plutella xylostella]
MFPYPSGNLHMGHVRVYSISDTISRFQKLCGYNVVHPMGWDAFGLPAENAAIERNIPPTKWTLSNITSMKQQLLQLAFDFNWDREISTCDPAYYKWTQYIFLKLFEKGLAYQNKALVNWDPVDKTVLADEQVDDVGCSWRSGAKVEKKVLTQWFVKTTMFAQKLYDGLNNQNLENWKDIINLQKHWIGECSGVVVNFKLKTNTGDKLLDVWTSEPHKFIHGSFLTISSTNVAAQELASESVNTLTAYNPVTGAEIPVYVSDDASYAEGRDVHIACPQTCEHDKHLADILNISVEDYHVDVEGDGKKAIQMAKSKNVGGYVVSSKLKDWLISRQRYWGTPIPIIHCPNCGAVPVPYEDLPVKLPEIKSLELGIQTLATAEDWINCECPKCHQNAKRETDTMDTFVDSSWYYYRFLDPQNNMLPFDKSKLEGNTPVHMYIGGKEHAVLHLYYARFMSYFLHSLGWTPNAEPFKKLIVQGMVMGQSYKLKSSGKYIPPENVYQVGNDYKEKGSDEPLLVQWEKMSKSKYNGENPSKLLETYGCDTTRLLILADVPPATSRRWSDATFPGVLNWQKRLWMTMQEFITHRKSDTICKSNNFTDENFTALEQKIADSRNYFIANTTYHFKYTQKLSVGISRLQGLTNVLRNKLPPEIIARSEQFELALASLIIMLSPITPHFCSELWAGLREAPGRICNNSSMIKWDNNVLEQSWPVVDDDYELSFLCKVDGADRCELKVKAADLPNMSQEMALEMMLKEAQVSKRITRGILKSKYELYPECRAILHITSIKKDNVIKVAAN